ncbi:MAG TPA: hypothetical protein EYG08_04075 [Myxococcales bacterium]|nr:hypothetical protein [Myxococcales bacterium]
MLNSGIVWGRASLNRFIADAIGVVPGTLMTYAGVPDARDRTLFIVWLEISTVWERCRRARVGPRIHDLGSMNLRAGFAR